MSIAEGTPEATRREGVLPPPPGGAHPLPRLRSYLIALVLAVLLPAMAFAAAASWAALRRQDAAAEARLLDTARALAAAVDSQIAGQIAALEVLAAAPAEDPLADPDAFRARAATTAAIFGGWVAVYTRGGGQVLNTQRPPGAPLPGHGGASGPGGGGVAIEQAFATGRPVVTGVAVGRVSRRLAAYIFVPVRHEGVIRHVLGMPLLPERLARILAGQAAAGRGAAALTDSNGVFVARSRDQDQVIGQRRPQRSEPLPGDSGVLRGRSLPDGSRIRTAYHSLATAPGWHAWVNEPEASFQEARRGPMLALAGGGLLALVIGMASAAALSRRLLRPVESLAAWAGEVAEEPGRGRALPPPVPATTQEFERLRAAITAAEAALRRVQRIGRVGGFEVDLRPGHRLRSLRSAEYVGIHGASGPEETHQDWVRRLHPEDRERAERAFFAAVADGAGSDYEQEYRILGPQGGVRWIYARGEIERDPQGRAIRMVGAHVDVTALKSAEAALRDSEERLRLALEAAQLGAWEVDLASGKARRTPRALAIFGFGPEARTDTYPSWRDRVHPADRKRLAEAVDALRLGEAETYRLEYRFQRPDGQWIWVESHGRAVGRDPLTGLPTRLIGTTQDITDRKQAEERQEVLVHELDHRAKNTLAVVQAALRLTPRGNATTFARAVEGRVNALARLHTLLARNRWAGATLRDVAEDALAPFLGPGSPAVTVQFDGPELMLGSAAVQALSMTLHELASNAARHGALAKAGGRVAVAWDLSDTATLHLAWREEGGAQQDASAEGQGFGSALITATVTRQLGGRIETVWDSAGLRWEAWLPLDRLVPGEQGGPPAWWTIPAGTGGPAEPAAQG
ncbi:sensor histidine kinase [Roseomonas sp. AR75]|uniref:sensor histidine kinase n=1 Tax=Roseomonas sp. AR75 TaxID=2562311 RepID=UPI0010C12FF5|nr:sensor histidine kinase [Roseomonas sp. AR75]